jgi:hypothetical protein
VVLATLGKRETDPRGVADLAVNERAPVRKQALRIAIRAMLIATLATAIALLI